jgi:hypothetical protein
MRANRILLAAVLSLAAAGCGGAGQAGEDSSEDVLVDAGTGSGGKTVGAGGGAAGGAGRAGAPGTGGKSGTGGAPGAGGSPGKGGSVNAGGWTDISPSGGKASGVVVNRLTGDVLVDSNGAGVFKSTDQGATYTRVDDGTVSGIAVIGPGFDVDQDNPTRAAVWSLDGDAGWTSDGSTWTKMAPMGRNWDFGGTDWATPDPKTMIGALHESGGGVYLSTDGSASWDKLSITVLASGGGWPPPAYAMVGVMDASTLVYSNGAGIYRSTDTGSSFTKVSDYKPQTRVPVLFKGVFYLGGSQGLMVSKDKGATWQMQGSAVNMWVGPLFGADENSMVVESNKTVSKTVDGGTTWTKVADLPADTKYDPQVWGGCAWDPINDVIYIAACDTPALKYQLAR